MAAPVCRDECRPLTRGHLQPRPFEWLVVLGEDHQPLFFSWQDLGEFPAHASGLRLFFAPAEPNLAAPMKPSSDADRAYLQQADALMDAVQATLDRFDPDELEADTAIGVLKIRFADGQTCVMNRQTAAHQIWLAFGASAWHFTFETGTGLWMDTKGRGELKAVLAQVIGTKLGRTVAL